MSDRAVFEEESTQRGELRRLIESVLATYAAGHIPDRKLAQAAVTESLALLAAVAPGRSVEVRVPPFGAVQAVAGGAHRRGTPRAVVETDPATWLQLATGRLTWDQAQDCGALLASGERSNLREHLPLVHLPKA